MKIGNVNGAKGTLRQEGEPEVSYEIHSVDGGMEKNMDAEATFRVDGVEWRVKFSSDSRASHLESVRRGGEEMPVREWDEQHWALIRERRESEYVRPAWVPAWAECHEPGPNGFCDLVWTCVGDAIHALERGLGREPDEDLVNYSVSNGDVDVWDESDEDS